MKKIFLRALVMAALTAFLTAWPGGTGRVSATPVAMFGLNTFDCFSGPQYPKNPPPGYTCDATIAGTQLTGVDTSFTPLDAGIRAAELKIYSPNDEILFKASLTCANCQKGVVPKAYELRLSDKDQRSAGEFLRKGNRIEVSVRTGARVSRPTMEFERRPGKR